MEMFMGAILVIVGYLLCWLTQCKSRKIEVQQEKKKIEVEKVVNDFKNPFQTYKKVINRDGLYSPQKPKRGVTDGRKEQ